MADSKLEVKEEKKETLAKKAPKKATAKKTSTAKAKAEKAPAEVKKAVEEKKVEAKEATKASKTEAKAKVEESKKPAVTVAKAKALTLKVTPRKLRLVTDLVRGKDLDEALGILANISHHKAAKMVEKLLRSASANAVNNFGMKEDKLYVAEIMASDSIRMKRFLPRAKGSASGMVKRYSNMFVALKERN
jgi:large subunit ribosomal protein L22